MQIKDLPRYSNEYLIDTIKEIIHTEDFKVWDYFKLVEMQTIDGISYIIKKGDVCVEQINSPNAKNLAMKAMKFHVIKELLEENTEEEIL